MQAQKQTDLILNKDTEPIVSYLADRTWRMSIFFNVAVLIFASLLAKIATNFVNGQPGAAGFRVSTTTTIHLFLTLGPLSEIWLMVVEWTHEYTGLQV